MSASTIARTSPDRERRSKTVRTLRSVVLHPGKLNQIIQVRKTYYSESIDALADSIAALGQIELPVVAELDSDHVGPYLGYFNQVLDADFKVTDLVQDYQTGHYFVVICGHRRTKACLSLWQNGCSNCCEQYGSKAAQKCVRGHDLLISQGIEVRARFNIDPVVALQIQIAENTKEEVSREEAATALRSDYEALRRVSPKLSKVAFSRMLNIKLSVIISALRFCDLPESVKKSYREKMISFTAAVELWRLQDAGCSQATIEFCLKKIVAGRMKTTAVNKYVSGVIKARHPDECISLFDENTEGQENELKRVIDRTAHIAFLAEASALASTQRAIENGLLPRVDVTLNPLVKRSLDAGTSLREQIIRSSRS